jgi:N,N'-diacetyllegionaminate synthase
MKDKVVIIAEAGVNHNGDIKIAKKLIDVAAKAKVDYVKFQTFSANKVVSSLALKAEYQQTNLADDDSSQFKMLKKLELPKSWHFELYEYCLEKKIKFLSTPFDNASIDFLDELNLDYFKIPSGELTNKPYLEYVASKNKKIILSTGMAYINEIRESLDVITSSGIKKSDITILHCSTNYPTPMTEVNLHAMNTIANEFDISVGYSDHTMGIEVPIAAVALGAKIIEKHFTLSRKLEGPDHIASLEPNELIEMVKCIRNIEKSMSGNRLKEPNSSELKNKDSIRRSLHFNSDLRQNHVLTKSDIISLRPGNGISPMNIDNILGKSLKKPVLKYQMINDKNFK